MVQGTILLLQLLVRVLMLYSVVCELHCCVVVYVSQLSLPLSNRVGVPVALGAIRHGDKDVHRGRDDIVDVDNGLLRSETNKQTNTR